MDEKVVIQNPIEISSNNNASEQLQYYTSANYLCNFLREREYMIRILKDMAIRPRYCEERIDYLGIRIKKH